MCCRLLPAMEPEMNEQPSPSGLSMSHISGWTPGAAWDALLQPRRGGPPQPRPTAWVIQFTPLGFSNPERA